ncbi:MAG: O-antigen ligase family protein [Actinomycetes bacterium]
MKALLPAFVVLPLIAAILIAVSRDPLRYLLPAYIVSVPFGSKLSLGLPAPFDSLSTPLLILLILTTAYQAALGVRTRAPLSATLPTWVLFLGWAALSAQWSVSAQLTTTGVYNLMALVLLFGLLSVVRVDALALRNAQAAIVFSGAAAGLYALAQLLLLGGLPVEGDAGARFGADILGANNTAAALLLPLAIALPRAVSAERRSQRLLNLAAALLVGVAIVLSGSRGGLLATLVVFVVIFLATPTGRRQLGWFMVVALGALVIVLATNPGGVGSRQTGHATSSGRSEIWWIAEKACESYCVAGSGWGTFPRVYQEIQPEVPQSRVLVRGTAYEAHNIWIEALIQVGFPGLVLLGAGLVLTFRDIRRLPQRLRAPPLAAFLGTMTASMFLSNFEYKFFWLVLMYVVICRSASFGASPVDTTRPTLQRVPQPMGAK